MHRLCNLNVHIEALEEEAKKKNYVKSTNKDTAVERTYEWIHTQVAGGDGRVEREDRVSSGESQLPYMDKRVLEGGRTQLVVGSYLCFSLHCLILKL